MIARTVFSSQCPSLSNITTGNLKLTNAIRGLSLTMGETPLPNPSLLWREALEGRTNLPQWVALRPPPEIET